MPHDTEYWCKTWRKTNFLFQKWQEFDEFLFEQSKISKMYTLIDKVCNVWPNNVQRSYRSGHWSFMQNLKKNWFVVWKIFYQNTWKCQSWDFEGTPLSKVENAWAKTLQVSYV